MAGLDFGSNTTLMLIAEVEESRINKILCDETRITKMGQGVHNSRRFHPDALARIRSALADYRKLIDHHQPDVIRAVATSAARDVENSEELFEMARSFGIPLTVISGNEEAALTFKGAFSDRTPKKDCCVIDVGGGSTELIFKSSKGSIVGESIDVGSVRLMDLFGSLDPMGSDDFDQMGIYIRERLNPNWSNQGFTSGVAVAGTPTILAAMELQLESFDSEKVDGFVLTKTTLEKWMNRLKGMSLSEREKIKGLPPKRADVIVAGTAVLYEFMRHLHLSQLEVSVRGVRYGLVLS
ncbi:Ppx/GppA family phosphatase [bacterium]|nr:Ppx/GppA family phosphatase [bacterium]